MSISQIKPNFTVSKVNKNVPVFKKFSIFFGILKTPRKLTSLTFLSQNN